MDSQIAAVLDEAFPDREVAETSPPGPSWNEQNRTVQVTFADGETIYLKLAVDGDPSGVVRESAVIPYVGANCEIPVPTVLASEPEHEIPYLATAPVPAADFLSRWDDASESERKRFAREVGESLARLHGQRFDRHGHVVGGGAAGLELDAGPWTDVLVDTIEDLREITPDEQFEHHFDDVIAAVEDNRNLLGEAPAALLHGDTAVPNCFRTDGRIGFLDWEIAHVGDPVRDLQYTRDQHFDSLRSTGPEELVTAFYDGYRAEAGGLPVGFDDRLPVYEAVNHLGISGHVERIAEFHDEPRTDLVEWIDAEMYRLLEAIR
jgi:aminoglycoside phosphotransferase (APT) family kinase protein